MQTVLWAEITVTADPQASEAVSAALMDAGCAGVAIADGERTAVSGWLPITDAIEPRIDFLQTRLEMLGAFGLPNEHTVTVRRVEDVDWLSEWRKHHRPLQIGERLLICPSWESIPTDSPRATVLLDPGMAFGTGSHATTRLCLERLVEIVEPGMSVADVGTGSGILAIAAAKLGASRVYASEIDALPRRIAAENAALNEVADRITILTPEELELAHPVCDLVVCNIIADTIAELASQLRSYLAPHASLVLSGIVEERLHIVTDAFQALGMQPAEVYGLDVWRLLVYRADPASAS